MKTEDAFAEAVSRFGVLLKSKLSTPAISGQPEDQIRAPLEAFIQDMAGLSGLPSGSIVAVGETSLSDMKLRPDYAIARQNALVGFIEVKAPGKGADPRRFTDKHDKEQWDKLKSLPNLLYTDGNAFSLWRNGELEAPIIVLGGDVEKAGADLSAPITLLGLFSSFFDWEPIPPRNAVQLADISAHLCRLLREEAIEQLNAGSAALTSLAEDWRRLLFPEATNEQFADGYAQAVTFGLLVARAHEICLSDGLDGVAKQLAKTNTLIGLALRLLVDDAENQETLKTSLQTLIRVLDAVSWEKISKGDPGAWLYFYEHFLSAYDNELRKKTGSYYTPPEVVTTMVRLVDDLLRDGGRYALAGGLASPDVTVADPAVGTGTFLLGILHRIAETTEADQGPGAVGAVVRAALDRVIGFELQFGPFAVAQLRLLAEVVDLTKADAETLPSLRLYVADTLDNPDEDHEWIPKMFAPLAESRKKANQIKRSEPITVVIGNPPYKEKAKGRGGWVEQGTKTVDAPFKAWMPPKEWGVGAHAKHLYNLYVYFWRWAAWKVFGGAPVLPGAPGGGGTQGDRLLHHRCWFSQRPRFREDARRPAPRHR
ncbi:putative DNA methyltransferase (fragment) [uncultured Alphaproteobacteria bacterium]|uniref:site-specific DNA-methyltransferase (adenine-specific) n=1 Tax=uncultured Alphaproteobacteria bacterium TaxID=91750 RepID=A0A212JZS5_9PROT